MRPRTWTWWIAIGALLLFVGAATFFEIDYRSAQNGDAPLRIHRKAHRRHSPAPSTTTAPRAGELAG